MTSQIDLPVTQSYTERMTTPHPHWLADDESKPAPDPLSRSAGAGQHRRAARRLGPAWRSRPTRDPGWWPTDCLAPDSELRPDDLALVRGVREGLRAMLVHNAGGPPPTPGAFAPLREIATVGTARADFDERGEIVLSATGDSVPARLVELLLIIRDAQRDGTWARLKACGNDECQWAFYDRSRNHGGTWCEMSSCGNKLKNREFRARKRGARSG